MSDIRNLRFLFDWVICLHFALITIVLAEHIVLLSDGYLLLKMFIFIVLSVTTFVCSNFTKVSNLETDHSFQLWVIRILYIKRDSKFLCSWLTMFSFCMVGWITVVSKTRKSLYVNTTHIEKNINLSLKCDSYSQPYSHTNHIDCI